MNKSTIKEKHGRSNNYSMNDDSLKRYYTVSFNKTFYIYIYIPVTMNEETKNDNNNNEYP